MSRQCLEEKLEAFKVSGKKREDILAKYDDYVIANQANGMVADASAQAAMKFAEIELANVVRKRQNIIRQLKAVDDFYDGAKREVSIQNTEWELLKKQSRVVKSLVDGKLTGWMFYKPSLNRELDKRIIMVDNLSKGIQLDAVSKMPTAMEILTPDSPVLYMSKLTYSPQRLQQIEDMWRAAAGEVVGDKNAMTAGAEIRKTFDDLTDMYIASGGIMARLDNWMPQIHDANALRVAGSELWRTNIKDKLDWNKIKDADGYLIKENDRDAFLSEVYETLSTDGLNKVEKAGMAGRSRFKTGGGVISKRGKHRVLHFISPEKQMEYNRSFGTDDLSSAILNHLDSMSRDIAVIQNLGPNPDAFMDNMKMRMATGEGMNGFTESMYNVLVGRTAMNGAESELYKYSIGANGLLRSAQLGAASIPALADSIYVGLGSKIAGVSGIKQGIGEYFKFVKNMGPEGKIDAELQLLAFDMAHGNLLNRISEGETFIAKGRSSGDRAMTAGQAASSWVMKASGLQWLTHHAKDSITIPAMGKVGYMRNKAWGSLDDDFREFMETSAGITKDDWENIQKAKPVQTPNGLDLVLPSAVTFVNRDSGIKYNAWISALRQLATNEPTIKTKAVTTLGQESGTISRAIANSAFMYKSFPITMLNNYIRTLATRSVKTGKTNELGAFLMLALSSGALTMLLKDLLRGKVPEGQDIGDRLDTYFLNPETMKRIALQSGALSVFDFVLQDQNRFGQTLGSALLGAPGNFAIDTYKLMGEMTGLVLLNGLDAAGVGGIDTSDNTLSDVGNAANKYMQRYTPGASLWYTRYALGQTVGDSVDRFLEGDKYHENRARDAKILEKQGLEYYEVEDLWQRQ